jgi:hypothetical protein
MTDADGAGVTATAAKCAMGIVLKGAAATKLAEVMLFPGMGASIPA